MKVCQLGLSGILALRLLWNLFKELFQILRHSCHPAYGFDDNASIGVLGFRYIQRHPIGNHRCSITLRQSSTGSQ